MTDVREQGLQVFRELLAGAVSNGDVDLRDGSFGDELLEIGIDDVFGRLWGREGVSHRDRSLVTLGILIACAPPTSSSSTSRSPATTGSPRTRSPR
jgi:4-carboxymuconolactone decarboxylase